VIGRQRLQFDLWGDAVNLAARMESTGVAGRVQVSDSTRSLLPQRFRLEPRDIEAKGLGRLTAYLVTGG
jgi:adenylate cyclase